MTVANRPYIETRLVDRLASLGAVAIHATAWPGLGLRGGTSPGGGVVLALKSSDPFVTVTPYVTWVWGFDPEHGLNLWSGHYHDSLTQALADYVERGGKPEQALY